MGEFSHFRIAFHQPSLAVSRLRVHEFDVFARQFVETQFADLDRTRVIRVLTDHPSFRVDGPQQ
jgi:hypothetical protein